jgi:DNA-binding GntR family transcriptional regulator
MDNSLQLDIDKRPALRDQVYQELRRAILSGPISPGSVLVQEQLAEQLGISRTPVRDALDRLANEGLVIRSNGGRVQVAPLSIAELREKYEVRQALEGLALRLAAEHLDEGAMAKLEALIQTMRVAAERHDHPLVTEAGNKFHDTIIAACSNKYLIQLLTSLNDSIRRYRQLAADLPGRAAENIQEHEQIYLAMAMGDFVLAEQRMEHHIAHSQQSLEWAIRHNQT